LREGPQALQIGLRIRVARLDAAMSQQTGDLAECRASGVQTGR